MNFNEFKDLVEVIKRAHPVWFGLAPDKSVNESAIVSVETKLEVKLPDEYKEFILKYGGGYFSFSIVYSLDDVSDWNLIKVNHEYLSLRAGYILISENGVGDFYGYKVINGICSSEIYFYDHETEGWEKTLFSNLFDYLKKHALTN